MHSELHERLEYLVNYSSQLIFVSGDSIAEQQKTLEAFVFQQHDDTEIAYLTAESNMDISDYRRQLCRQLLGQVVGSFVRPLNELLSSLNHFDGPVLIAITQAQHMPDKLLQELWDLVLQSRFAGNKQHLNVLLFANSQWAENAKQWLPAKNTETPLLISSQSISLEQPVSELDKMMSERRAAFQAHLDQRRLPVEQAKPNVLTSPWFYSAIAIVFLAIFGGLVSWQYGDTLRSLFSPIASPSSSDMSSVAPGSAYDKVALSDGDASRAAVIDGNSMSDVGEEAVQAESASTDNSSASALVTNWQEAVETLPASPTATENALANEPANSDTQQGLNNEAEDAGSTNIIAPPVSANLAPSRNDSPISEETTRSPPAAANNAPPVASSTTSETLNGVANWLNPSDFAIQMMGMRDINAINQFIAQYQLEQVTRIYKTRRYGGDWYVMVYHRAFSSISEARRAAQELPNYPSKADAFVKGGAQILSEIALAADQ